MTRRAAPLAVGACGLAVGVASVAAGRDAPGWWFAGESSASAALELVTGLVLIAIGVAAWLRRAGSRFGPLLALAGIAWFLPEWNSPEAGGAATFTAGLALAAACPALVAHAALAYPGGRLRDGTERAAVASAYVVSAGVGGILPAVVYDPGTGGCADCPANLLLIGSDDRLAESLQRLGLELGAAWIAVVCALAARRIVRGSVAERRLVLPVLAPATLYLVATAVDWVHSAGRGFLGNDATDRTIWTVQALALIALGLGVTWEWVRARRTRAALASLVVELERSPAPGGLREALAVRLGDPSLELVYGPAPKPRPGRELTPLTSGGRELALVAHKPGLFDDQALAEQLAAGARLALDNERLQSELRGQLDSLRASRARLVDAGDRERRRLERDLHDGAQQRLVALSIGLAIAQQTSADPAIELAQREVKGLLADLRALAHGIYPVALAEEGLAAALDALVEEPGSALTLERPPPAERLAPQVEAAAYLVVREVARRGASVELTRVPRALVLLATPDSDLPGEMVHLEDRVGAVGGSLRVERAPSGLERLRVELPCA